MNFRISRNFINSTLRERGRHCFHSERNIMKKTKRDLIFSVLSVFLIAFLMFAEISSGMAIYADTFNNNGAMPHENNGNGDINDNPGLENSGDNHIGSNDESNGSGNTPDSDNSSNDTTAAANKNDGNMAVWGWILAVVVVIIIIAIIVAAVSKKRKTDEEKR